MSKNAGGHWMVPTPARFVQNTVVPEPMWTHFWSYEIDKNGHPYNLYHPPLLWQHFEPPPDNVPMHDQQQEKR